MMSSSAIYPYPEHWELTTLGQLCTDSGGGVQTGPFGSQLHAADYVDVGIPSIMPKNISIEGVSTEDIARITKEDAQRLSKYLVKEGDIVYSRRGDVEKCSLITEKENGWLCGTGCLKVSFGENSSVPSGYIHAYLSHPAIWEWISRHAVGATMPNLNTSILSAVPVLVPPKDEIDIILSVWKNTTDKIILNRQTNQTLEHMAQAIFKSWFVDFEPTRAKIAAKEEWAKRSITTKAGGSDNNIKERQTEATFIERAAMAAISGRAIDSTNDSAAGALAGLDQLNPEQLQQLKTTAALFPDALVDSELGEIPEGWEVTRLGEATTEIRRGISPKYTEENGVRVVNQKCIRNHSINFNLTRLNDPEKRKIVGREIELGDVLVNSTGVGTLGRLAPVRYLKDQTVFDSHVTVVRADTNKITKSFLAGLMIEKESFIESSGAGSTGQTELRKQVLEDIEFAMPPIELGEIFENIANPINKEIATFELQQQSLSETRDVLLPKLLSGELPAKAHLPSANSDMLYAEQDTGLL
jgi:type I restriction enzyme S subunit